MVVPGGATGDCCGDTGLKESSTRNHAVPLLIGEDDIAAASCELREQKKGHDPRTSEGGKHPVNLDDDIQLGGCKKRGGSPVHLALFTAPFALTR